MAILVESVSFTATLAASEGRFVGVSFLPVFCIVEEDHKNVYKINEASLPTRVALTRVATAEVLREINQILSSV